METALLKLYESDSHVLGVEVNLAYFVQALGQFDTESSEEVLIKIYEESKTPLIRRIIILSMARSNRHYWLTDVKNTYISLTEWEKRAIIMASYHLGDEGKHWRNHTKHTWGPIQELVRDWYSERFSNSAGVPL